MEDVDGQADFDEVRARIPSELKGLRSCLLCSLVKTFDQFYNDGCDNCEGMLGLRQNTAQIKRCTSNQFSGLISSIVPDASWVARWQRIGNYKPGVYAISVSGRLPERIVHKLADNHGINYENIVKLRDKTLLK